MTQVYRTLRVAPSDKGVLGVVIRTIDGVRIPSPWPESVCAFAPIWASLAEHAHRRAGRRNRGRRLGW
jgi:hypothetical protein